VRSACGRRLVVGLLAPTAGLLIVSAAVKAQGVTGAAIHGRVFAFDSTPVAEATLLVTNTSNGERWRTTTTSGGDYQVDHLSLGGPLGSKPGRSDSSPSVVKACSCRSANDAAWTSSSGAA
jgi:hypothetical protein